ncbi:fumarylacetoacetate hydrolase family protein [Nocardia asiatica]|uniref:fumarylacetoacetate hydrolase family protein n=1 Tax=Nocardia asiatica TaxID=209252 RepID=UPI00031BFC27|nr:fumarylacetoacetate hydrolase family protein [Nocardia asiatica]
MLALDHLGTVCHSYSNRSSGSRCEPGTEPGRCGEFVDATPTMVPIAENAQEARIATVDGETFVDLPELLVAAGGELERIVAGVTVLVDSSTLLSPVARPRKIVCIGQNYMAHVSEAGRSAAPEYPDLSAKWDNALSGPYADIPLPPESDQIDFESELAVIIGKQCRRVVREDVATVVFGYTAANDGSARDYQFFTSQRTAGKAWDGLTPLGPMVVPADRLGGAEPICRSPGR